MGRKAKVQASEVVTVGGGKPRRRERTTRPERWLEAAMHDASIAERFWSKVQRGAPDECWEWQASVTQSRGYGQFFPLRGVLVTAHRFSFALSNGAIDDMRMVLHRCDNRRCVNPSHLYAGNAKQNTRDMMRRGRGRSGLMQGERHGCHVLTDTQVRSIRETFRGVRGQQAELARSFGVNPSTIALIVSGKTWRHLEALT